MEDLQLIINSVCVSNFALLFLCHSLCPCFEQLKQETKTELKYAWSTFLYAVDMVNVYVPAPNLWWHHIITGYHSWLDFPIWLSCTVLVDVADGNWTQQHSKRRGEKYYTFVIILSVFWRLGYKTKCLPILYYGLDACPITKRQYQSLNYVLYSSCRKIFNINCQHDCIDYMSVFKCLSAEDSVFNRKCQFLSNYVISDNILCCACRGYTWWHWRHDGASIA